MYKPDLEFLGLICFFIINVIYSASIGFDLSEKVQGIFKGVDTATRWVLIILFGAIIISLILNFTSSVFTVMTLGNLYSEFEAKQLPIMLSPQYRTELNAVKGLFVASIVIITVVTLRIFVTPDQMMQNFFEWAKYIPDEFSNMGHFILCLVVFGLGVTLLKLVNTGKLNSASKDVAPDFTEGFKRHFLYLIIFIGFIVLWYLIQPIFLFFIDQHSGSDIISTIYKNAVNYTTQKSISLFELIILLSSFLIVIFSILGLTVNKDSSPENTKLNSIALSGGLIMLVAYFAMSIANIRSISLVLILLCFYYWFPVLVELGTNKNSKNIRFVKSPAGNLEFIFAILALAGLCVLLSFGSIYSSLTAAITNIGLTSSWKMLIIAFLYIFCMVILPVIIPLVNNKGPIPININESEEGFKTGLMTLGIVWMVIIICLIGAFYKGREKIAIIGVFFGLAIIIPLILMDKYDYILQVFNELINTLNHNSLPVSMVEMFSTVKAFLVGISIILSGFLIKEYIELPRDSKKFTMYNNKFNFEGLFVSFILFLVIVLVTSFFNSRNFPVLFAAVVEYISPVALLIISSLLIFYTDHLAKLSKKRVISDLGKKKKIKEDAIAADETVQNVRINTKTKLKKSLPSRGSKTPPPQPVDNSPSADNPTPPVDNYPVTNTE